jgi:hypothetical protein
LDDAERETFGDAVTLEDAKPRTKEPPLRPALLRTAVGALVAGAVLAPAVASAQAQSPSLRIHAIFTGGNATNFHVGEVLLTDVRNAGGRKITQICFTPRRSRGPRAALSAPPRPRRPARRPSRSR